MSTGTMSSFLSNFEKTDRTFLEFGEDLSTAEGSSSVGNNLVETTQPSSTPRNRAQSRLLKLERYVHSNSRIPMSTALAAEKPIFPYVVRFSRPLTLCSTPELALS
ncbi:CACTA en-spm transposon protein [Cucumis melo var. makuwa]|uniref:CACTA en-spm transposon protein n=1 Tax=Cucumis melo var. makuwa TaxID=1194695 RepID=A0A5D3DCL8_CUCMM|nr:CACTA en-spm transposon protein [Cucumis melo var. makuwa]